MTQQDAQRRRMIEVNAGQRTLYEQEAELKARGNGGGAAVHQVAAQKDTVATRTWKAVKRRVNRARQGFTDPKLVDRRFHRWLPSHIEDSDVLDLGCHTGHAFSLFLAKRCRSYLGVDLSEKALAILDQHLLDQNVPNGRTLAIDFLSDDFPDQKFDLVHAKSVLHHFEHLDVLMRLLHERTRPGAVVLTVDPMQTALSAKIARGLYRPFQNDRDWEWPFTRSSFEAIERYFEIENIQGWFGTAKWAAAASLVSPTIGRTLGERLHRYDLRVASEVGPGLWSCLYVATQLRRKDSVS